MLGNIFNVFSRRTAASDLRRASLTPEFRNRIFMLLRDALDGYLPQFLSELQQKLAYLHGRATLTGPARLSRSQQEDVLDFLQECSDEHFLDAVEYFFQVNASRNFRANQEELIGQINQFLKIDELPYYLTESVWEEIDTHLFGNPTKGTQLREYPKIIRKDSDLLHATAIEPTLALLRKPDLLNANEEFMLALEDYKKGDFKDCLSKCCSSLESVMKVICDRKKYSYQSSDSASPLLKTILSKSNLDTFWEQPIILIATIRNKLSSSHGAGIQPKSVPQHVAKYAINATASAILFLIDEAY
jgi:hypothetical protein